MKIFKAVLSFVLPALIFVTVSQSRAQYDSLAISILDSMSNRISDLESCSFRFISEYDIPNSEYGLITHSDAGICYLKAPDKLYVEKKGDRGNREFYYNGKYFLVYSGSKNQYAKIPAEITIIELIDSVSSYFGVEFPGADVFYPDFVNNILETSNNLVFLGGTRIDNEDCYHIAGAGDDMTFQIWVSADGKYLPVKMTLIELDKPMTPRYQFRYYDWALDEFIDDSKFEFVAPQGAQIVKILERNQNQ